MPDDVVIRQPAFAIAMLRVVGIGLFVLALWVLAMGIGGGPGIWGILIPLAAFSSSLGFFALTRGVRARIELGPDALTVVGMLITRSIPRQAISTLHDNGTIEWTDGRGWSHLTGLGPLPSRGAPGPMGRFRIEALARVQAWIDATVRP